MTLQELPVVMQILRWWKETKGKRVEGAILRELRKHGPMKVTELSGWVGYPEADTDAQLNLMAERQLVYFSNNRWFIGESPKIARLG